MNGCDLYFSYFIQLFLNNKKYLNSKEKERFASAESRHFPNRIPMDFLSNVIELSKSLMPIGSL